MSFAGIILALVTLQRLGELVLARHNTAKLLARGGIEIGAKHYPLLVSVHAAWLIAGMILGMLFWANVDRIFPRPARENNVIRGKRP